MQLVIVGSPYKKKTLQKYLGAGWRIEACMGQLCDLPVYEMGVRGPHFQPQYELLRRGEIIVKELKRIAMQAECVWLATDPDREGEAIAWHLARYLKPTSIKRIDLYEMTEQAIKTALNSARAIDQPLFEAQAARRVIDRLVGYQVSPRLSQALDQPLSAGRVQSVAVKWIVERERAIRQFRATAYFGARLHFVSNVSWYADWDIEPLVSKEAPYMVDGDLAKKVSVVNAVRVMAIEPKEIQEKAPAPFITTTLQKAAYFILGSKVEQTMSLAQSLFEKGFISYHRTDNPNFLEASLREAKRALTEMGYSHYLPDTPNHWKATHYSQEAHEAIRPTDFLQKTIESDTIKEKALYQLIRLRALASQLSAATLQTRTITLQIEPPIPGMEDLKVTFKAAGQTLLYPGWRCLIERDQAEEKPSEAKGDSILPSLQEGDRLLPERGEVLTLHTKAPKRYSEPALISKLEKEGIGRPSTYALILNTIQHRGYVTQKDNFFYAEPLAEKVIDTLQGKFKFLENAYTRQLEASLDEIANGKQSYLQVVSKLDHELQKDLALLDKSLNTPYACPTCQAPLKRVRGKQGYFFGCSRYPKGCKTVLPNLSGKLDFEKPNT